MQYIILHNKIHHNIQCTYTQYNLVFNMVLRNAVYHNMILNNKIYHDTA